MTGPGYGVPWLRIDHDLVGRVLAVKERQRLTAPADSSFRIDDPEPMALLNRRRVASGRVG